MLNYEITCEEFEYIDMTEALEEMAELVRKEAEEKEEKWEGQRPSFLTFKSIDKYFYVYYNIYAPRRRDRGE